MTIRRFGRQYEHGPIECDDRSREISDLPCTEAAISFDTEPMADATEGVVTWFTPPVAGRYEYEFGPEGARICLVEATGPPA